MATTGEDVERLLSGIFPSPAKHGGGCGGVTERRWFTPCRPLKSHLSRSRRSVCNSTPPYPPPQDIIYPHTYRPTKLTTMCLQRRRSSGWCRDYRGIGREGPPGFALITSGSGYESIRIRNQGQKHSMRY